MALTPKQARFVDEYLIDRNGAQAAIRAGYSRKAAREIAYGLLTKPHIAARVAQGAADTARELRITREDVIRGLVEAIELARSQGNPSAMIAGCAQIAKLLGYYAPEKRKLALTTGQTRLRTRYEEMSEEALLELAAG